MLQDNVRQFVRQHGRQCCLIRQHIHQSPAQHDRPPHHKRFQRRRQQYTATHRGNIEIIRHQNVVDHGFENAVHVAAGRHESRHLQPLHHVVIGCVRRLPDRVVCTQIL